MTRTRLARPISAHKRCVNRPVVSRCRLYPKYTDASIRLGKTKPGGKAQRKAIAEQSALQRRLWSLAGQALDQRPSDSAPRLYAESLNAMIDQQTTRVAGLGNRVPTAISLVQVIGAAAALALMALYLALMSRGVVTVLIAAALLTFLLFVTFDLDRPARGFITIPETPSSASGSRWSCPRCRHTPLVRFESGGISNDGHGPSPTEAGLGRPSRNYAAPSCSTGAHAGAPDPPLGLPS